MRSGSPHRRPCTRTSPTSSAPDCSGATRRSHVPSSSSAARGVVVTIGNSSEQDTTFNARTLYGKGAARIHGLIVFEEVRSGRVGARDLESLMQLVLDGKLQAPISLRRNWTELPMTLLELEQREYPGKAVLRIGP